MCNGAAIDGKSDEDFFLPWITICWHNKSMHRENVSWCDACIRQHLDEFQCTACWVLFLAMSVIWLDWFHTVIFYTEWLVSQHKTDAFVCVHSHFKPIITFPIGQKQPFADRETLFRLFIQQRLPLWCGADLSPCSLCLEAFKLPHKVQK